REIRSIANHDYICAQLQKHHVKVEVRALELGDIVWVARRHSDMMELVLNWIIERKRMDDLVASMKDGRFAEQKARLRCSGADRVVYIIEEYDSAAVDAFNPQAIISAISTTQTRDGFFVKRTSSTDHTITYLTTLHNELRKMETQQLDGIPDKYIDRATYLALRKHLTTPHFISYRAYCTLNNKSNAATLQHVFTAMLATVRGVSFTKAQEIAAYYHTPGNLLAAYSSSNGDDKQQMMIYSAMGPKVTAGISARIYEKAVTAVSTIHFARLKFSTCNPLRDFARDTPTYNCPAANISAQSIITYSRVIPCDLCIDNAHARSSGSCIRLARISPSDVFESS
ncbi:restriction endonuclease type II-like protein, partial [Jimgerdemannia flammicorona]